MRRIIGAIGIVVMLGGCSNTAQAGCRLRVVNYNVAKLNSENPELRAWLPVGRRQDRRHVPTSVE